MEYLIGIAIVAWLIWFIMTTIKRGRLVANDNEFEQYGVNVNFKTGKITMSGITYDVNQVTGIRSVDDPKLGDGLRRVEIEVDDFKKPIHKIAVPGYFGTRKEFAQRLSVALRKAGGPSFN